MTIRSYRDGSLTKENGPLDSIAPADLIWVDLCEPTDDDLAEVGEELGLHALAIEDAVQRNQRPKLDHYEGHLFVAMYWVSMHAKKLHVAELAVFATDTAVVTVRWPDGPDLEDAHFELPPTSVGTLLHGLLDLVVDSHLDAVQGLDEELDKLEDQVFSDNPLVDITRRTARLRRNMAHLRRLTLPVPDIVTGLLRHEPTVVDKHLTPYFRDVLDHAVHATEWLDSLREIPATIRDTQLNVQGNRLNVIMKKVTAWAAIIAVPTAITGFYGQNLPYPGYEQPWGFWFSTAVISALSVGLYIFFRRRDWM